MTAALLIDIGGVLAPDHLPEAATAWAARLGITPDDFLIAVFAGDDDQILIGRTTEAAWWRVIADRLHVDGRLAEAIRADLAARRTWDTTLLTGLRRVRPRATITVVSNAWPDLRADIDRLGLADSVVLSCEVGYAKPDPRIYAAALSTAPADALFIDDTPPTSTPPGRWA
jgi:putative hydrolase of the HAD superfamily